MVAYQDTRTAVLYHPAYVPADLLTEFCIEDCLECLRACECCAQSGLRGLPLGAMLEYRALLQECADYAAWTARALAKNEPGAADWCGLCAQLCDVCAKECAAWEAEALEQCAAACRRCAESCRELYPL
jgi:hypothetical protein